MLKNIRNNWGALAALGALLILMTETRFIGSLAFPAILSPSPLQHPPSITKSISSQLIRFYLFGNLTNLNTRNNENKIYNKIFNNKSNLKNVKNQKSIIDLVTKENDQIINIIVIKNVFVFYNKRKRKKRCLSFCNSRNIFNLTEYISYRKYNKLLTNKNNFKKFKNNVNNKNKNKAEKTYLTFLNKKQYRIKSKEYSVSINNNNKNTGTATAKFILFKNNRNNLLRTERSIHETKNHKIYNDGIKRTFDQFGELRNIQEFVVQHENFTEIKKEKDSVINMRLNTNYFSDNNTNSSNLDRNERSTFFDISGPARRIQLYIKNRFIQLMPDGTVNGTQDDMSDYTILQRTTVDVGRIKIQGIATCLYLCMDQCGQVYGSKKFSDDCVFNESMEQHNYNTYSSTFNSNSRRIYYLALNRRGEPRKLMIPPTRPLGKLATYTKSITETVQHERVELLIAKTFGENRVKHGIRQLCDTGTPLINLTDKIMKSRPTCNISNNINNNNYSNVPAFNDKNKSHKSNISNYDTGLTSPNRSSISNNSNNNSIRVTQILKKKKKKRRCRLGEKESEICHRGLSYGLKKRPLKSRCKDQSTDECLKRSKTGGKKKSRQQNQNSSNVTSISGGNRRGKKQNGNGGINGKRNINGATNIETTTMKIKSTTHSPTTSASSNLLQSTTLHFQQQILSSTELIDAVIETNSEESAIEEDDDDIENSSNNNNKHIQLVSGGDDFTYDDQLDV